MSIEIITIKNNPVDSNCYLIFDKDINNKCPIVDPGSKDASFIENEIESHGLGPDLIFLTHEHFDHVWGCNALAGKYGVITYGSSVCLENMQSKRLNCSRFYDDTGFEVNVPAKPVETDGKMMYWNGYELNFYHTPGHSDASICFSIGDNLFTGDTLIYGLKTVTNILSGSKEKLKLSLKMLKGLQGMRYTVYPGHGEVFELGTYNLDKILNQ
jgi:glyoxylase-like metal-dependent hydrolase (beta-lactamase superfamily II)